MNKLSVRTAILQATTVLALTLPLIAAGIYVWQKHVWAQSLIAELEPRHARLQGVQAMQTELKALVVGAQNLLSSQTYPATLDATMAGNDAQQRIRSAFTESQLNVESIQVIAAKDSEHFQRIGVTLVAEGTLPSIQDALLKLSSQSPTILVDSFSIQSTGAVRPSSTQRLSGSFSFSVLRVKS